MVVNQQTERVLEVAEKLIGAKLFESWADMCSQIGYSPQNWNEVRKKKRNVTVEFIATFCIHFGINSAYIMVGEYPVFVQKSKKNGGHDVQNATKNSTTNSTTNDTTNVENSLKTLQIVNESDPEYRVKKKTPEEEPENTVNIVLRLNRALLEGKKTITITIHPDDVL
ncbi:MAG TPA: hypothetical protein VL947_14255 [Cytophagales bacterium]|nr:hypothetical protein [Cytophagales bacterium]